eukprot:TRINITY_DN7097_c0_g1_i1.p1 TRINITY_DN7097_c0_g1~~TRINITY_DN7097_c0_g1_i1.p1  ORF type:complete len:390 (-),score=26.28 TRINITY_DN7097_c0_g1_i1:34-1050(-)
MGSGYHHWIVLLEDGTVYACGTNTSGQLGQGHLYDISLPTKIDGLSQVRKVACGGDFSCAILRSGSLYVWGNNLLDKQGKGHTDCLKKPTHVPLPGPVRSVSCGTDFIIAFLEDNQVYCWGGNEYSQLGLGTSGDIHEPTPNPFLSHFKSISCGWKHALGITKEGALYAWGRNAHGQLGIGPEPICQTPTLVMEGIQAVACGAFHTLAVSHSSDMWGWGTNSNGELGVTHIVDSCTPVRINFMWPSLIVGVGCGNNHSFAVLENGNMYVWGQNSSGQIGIEETSTRVPIVLPLNVTTGNWRAWHSIFKWLFLGRSDPKSILYALPLEVVFELVEFQYE